MDEAEAPQDMPNDQTVQKQVHVGRNVQPDQALPVPSKGVNETPQRPRSQPGFTGLLVNRGQALGVRHCGKRRTTGLSPQGKNLPRALFFEVSLGRWSRDRERPAILQNHFGRRLAGKAQRLSDPPIQSPGGELHEALFHQGP